MIPGCRVRRRVGCSLHCHNYQTVSQLVMGFSAKALSGGCVMLALTTNTTTAGDDDSIGCLKFGHCPFNVSAAVRYGYGGRRRLPVLASPFQFAMLSMLLMMPFPASQTVGV